VLRHAKPFAAKVLPTNTLKGFTRRTVFGADTDRDDGKRFVTRVNEKLTAFNTTKVS